MGDILSQNEIDELLKALNTGELDIQQFKNTNNEKKIKNHDFRRPSKFSKEHLKTLNIIYENYARLITNFLTGYLRTLVQIDVVEVQPLIYNDFSNSVSNPAIMSIVELTPLEGSIVFEIDPNIAFALIDRILGGKGTDMEKVRDFTEIEIAIIERIVIQILNLMHEPWSNVIELRPRLERIETNPQFAQIASPNEIIALTTLSVRVGEVEGLMNICIPYMVIEPVVPKLSTKFWFSTVEKGTTEESRKAIESKIEKMFLPVKAILGRTTITVDDFLDLQPGDVLSLDTKVDSPLEVLVGDLLKFYGQPGVMRKKVAVKVTHVVKREED